ncbi:hypothetical protein RD792_005488, partial [Penstemon davidsonii]
KRAPHKKLVEDSKLCAFELLAAVAGKLLKESESSSSSIVQNGNNNKALKSESCDHGSCTESTFVGVPQAQNNSDLKNLDCNINIKLGISKPEVKSEDEKKPIIGEYVNTNVPINHSDNSVQLSLYSDPIPSALLQKHLNNNVKLGIRDDDENSFGHKKAWPLKPQPRTGQHRRIRKSFTSKYWKIAPKLKDCELYNNTNDGMNTFYRYRKSIYSQERYQHVPIKKRKLYDHSFASSVSMRGHQKTKDPHVKFSIKSFRVPELYIEVPETATVGSLKRTVMEAVTAILGGGTRVGVVLQGEKVGDDNTTLQQAGISQSSTLDTLGFTLEPSFTHVSPSTTPKKLPLILPYDADKPLSRSPTSTPMIDSGISNDSIDPPLIPDLDGAIDNKEFVSSSQTTPTDALINESKALVHVPPVNAEALAVVPVNSKSKRSELSQRRIRRPFSVTEVEELVEAVEKLGTGRWRDVKMRSFENADHRTYVDLKDKWKTLVHTASISPQQRRGEPVPQELLNRVLSAHSYWSQNQSKLHEKHLMAPLKIVEEVVAA